MNRRTTQTPETPPVLRTTMLAAAVLLSATLVAALALRQPQPAGPRQVTETSAARSGQAFLAAGDELVVEADSRGHYYVDAEVNGESVRFLVDTGATMVALSPDDAARIGFRPGPAEFTGRARTANGIARIAPVMIDEIEVGDIRVRNVPGAVLDTAMRNSLLGMSFLARLSGFEVRGNRLILRQ